MAKLNHLTISEDFYSIQGEGPYAGYPAVFLRLAGCNLSCSGFSYQDPLTHEHLGCDTKAVWRQGKNYSFAQIIERWQQLGWFAALQNGAHCVITGGEPMLHQRMLIPFISYLSRCLQKDPFIEIETNATQRIEVDLLQQINHINASPKLQHSGEPMHKAYQPQVLAQLASLIDQPKACFKFVVASEQDILEIQKNYLQPFAISSRCVWLMAEGGHREKIREKAPWIVEQCKQHGFRYSPRLHLDIWDQATGV